MPAAIAVPAITGALGVGASIFGAHKQAGAAKDANNAQMEASREALAYEREKDAKAEAAEAQRQQRLQPLLEMRYALLSKYGAKIPTAGRMDAAPPMGGTQPPPIMGGQMPPEMGPEIERDPRAMAAIQQRRTLGSLPDWSRNAWMGGQ